MCWRLSLRIAVLRYMDFLIVRPCGVSLAEWNLILRTDWEIPCRTLVSSYGSVVTKAGAQPHPSSLPFQFRMVGLMPSKGCPG